MSSFTFEAAPRLVKTHSKYRPSTTSPLVPPSLKILQDPKFKALPPVTQEQEYIRLEKERIKIDNMHAQILNFKKNKKKMTPYDIKPSPNPRIEVNLQFFLTDSNNQPPKINIVDTQTDDFHPKPESPKFVPKKTGVDAWTQVEDDELFDFDREVKPIVEVIMTKTLEQSLLELEEEDELASMLEYKKEYQKRRDLDAFNMKNVLQKEIDRVADKNRMLDDYKKKQKMKIRIHKNLQAYAISSFYLKDLSQHSFENLLYHGFFPNNLQIQLQNDFTDYLAEQTEKNLNKMMPIFSFDEKDHVLNKFFEGILDNMKKTRQPEDLKREKWLEKMRKRKFNLLNKDKRVVRLFYRDIYQGTIPSFEARLFARFIDGTLKEYETNKENEFTALQAQVDNNEITEEEMQNIKLAKYPDRPKNCFGFLISKIRKIGFSLAHNMFYPSPSSAHHFNMRCLIFNKSGALTYNIDKSSLETQNIPFIKRKDNIRDLKQKTSDDEIFTINLEKLPPETYSLLFVVELPEYSKVFQNLEEVQYSRFSLLDTTYNLLYDSSVILKDYKFEDITKDLDPNTETGSFQTGMMFPYYMSRQSLTEWKIEFIKESKVFIGQELPKFLTEIPDFIKECIERFREEEFGRKDEAMLRKEEGGGKKDEKKDDGKKIGKQKTISISEEPQKVKTNKGLPNRAFKEVIISLMKDIEEVEEELIKLVEKDHPEILNFADSGIEFMVEGKPFSRTKQLRKVQKLGELEIRRKKEPEIIKEAEEEGEEGGEGEEADFKIDEV